MRAEHTSLLYYSSSRWLSRGNILLRTFELRQEIYIFLKKDEHKNVNEFSDVDFLIKLAYLCDIFEKECIEYLFARNIYAHAEVDGKNYSIYKKTQIVENKNK